MPAQGFGPRKRNAKRELLKVGEWKVEREILVSAKIGKMVCRETRERRQTPGFADDVMARARNDGSVCVIDRKVGKDKIDTSLIKRDVSTKMSSYNEAGGSRNASKLQGDDNDGFAST